MSWLSFAGDVIGAGLGLFGQKSANKTNQSIAQAQMDFQERMSSTAYQRARTDMEAAGYNPMLAFTQGGASSPGGAAIPVQNELSEAANSAKGMSRKMAEINLMKEQLKNVDADTTLKYTAADLNNERSMQSAGEQALTRAVLSGQLIRNQIDAFNVSGAKADAARAEAAEELRQTDLGKRAFQAGELMRSINPLLDGANSAKSLGRR
jgi:hypothetical protein